jgi:hypothetical protein
MHPPVQPAVADDSHMKFACTLQLPLQLAWHSAMQFGGVPLQLMLHSLEQLALHWPMQVVMSPLELHCPLHEASHLAEQSPEQLKLPGEQPPMHLPVQSAVQLPLTDPEHIAVTLAVQFTGVQSAMHPADVSNVQVRPVAPAKSIPPHAAMGAAWAVFGLKATRKSVAKATIADRYGRYFMGASLRTPWTAGGPTNLPERSTARDYR